MRRPVPLRAVPPVGPGQDQQVVVALLRMMVRSKPLTTEILFGQVFALDHHAPGPVEHEDAFASGGLQRGDTVGTVHWAAPVTGSRTPSTRQMA